LLLWILTAATQLLFLLPACGEKVPKADEGALALSVTPAKAGLFLAD
jgi:hypothetical protein